jgi:hypothetical protein
MIKKLLVISFLIGHISQGEITSLDLLSSSYALALKSIDIAELHLFIVIALPHETVTISYPLINEIMRQQRSTLDQLITGVNLHVSRSLESLVSQLIAACISSQQPEEPSYDQELEQQLGLTLAEGEKVLTTDKVESIENAMKNINIAFLPFALEPSMASRVNHSYFISAMELLIKLCDKIINLRGPSLWIKKFTVEESFGLSVLLIAALNKQLNLQFDEQIQPLEQYFSPILLQGVGRWNTVNIRLHDKIEERSLSLLYITLAKIIGISLKDVSGRGRDLYRSIFSTQNNLLHNAIDSTHLATIEQLLNEGINFDAQNSEGFTPLMILVDSCPSQGSKTTLDVIDLLLKKHPNLELKDHQNAMTALHWAAGWCPTLVAPLVKAGAEKNAKDKNGNRPRDLAVQKKQPQEIITLLT